MFTSSTASTAKNPGLDSMIGAWKDYLSGLTENQADLGSGLETNQITGKMKTVCTLLVPGVDIPGTMYRAINATNSLAIRVILIEY